MSRLIPAMLVLLIGCDPHDGDDDKDSGGSTGVGVPTGAGTGATGTGTGATGTGTGATGTGTGATGTGTGAPALCQRMSIPSYFYPGGLWDQADAEAPRVNLLIANPASGPGLAVDPNYVTAVANAQAAGVTVLGYVPTTYGARAEVDVNADIDAFVSWYGVDGIFFDETPTTPAQVAYYQSVVGHADTAIPGAVTVLNPGTLPDQQYQGVADILVVYESYTADYAAANLPDWTANYPADGFWHILHSAAGSAEIDAAVALSKTRNAGRFYATEDILVNPYDTLPIHFTGQLDLLDDGCVP